VDVAVTRRRRKATPQALLICHPDTARSGNAYAQRLRLYRGERLARFGFTPADTSDIQVATLSMEIGNWYLGCAAIRPRRAAVRAFGRFWRWPLRMIVSESSCGGNERANQSRAARA